jgi:cytochrome c-type biogenesis protein CcmH/NrfF
MWPLLVALLISLQAPAAPASGLSADLEREARAVEALVIAPCCWSQQVSLHDSPAATEMKADIRRRLGAGQNRQAILAAYVAEHGERILAEPPARGFNRLLYVLPPLLGLAGLGVLILVVRRFMLSGRVGGTTPAAAGAAPASGAYDARLDEELRDLD